MSTETTTDRLDEIEARLSAATADVEEGNRPSPGWTNGSSIARGRVLTKHVPAMLADQKALVAVVRALQVARPDLDHHHAHMVPGRWDKDGSHCDVCARVGAMDAALEKLGGAA